ncbi:hypothetical protein AAMO2058_000928100, partial [Amorphochlora amoebiformis]
MHDTFAHFREGIWEWEEYSRGERGLGINLWRMAFGTLYCEMLEERADDSRDIPENELFPSYSSLCS